jgi:Secretion system C-terminal sorting domain
MKNSARKLLFQTHNCSQMRRYYALGLFLILQHLAFSQITSPVGYEIGPLSTNAVLERFVELPRPKMPPPDSVDLPFMDDFSYAGPFPDPDLWLDRQVFINSTMSGNRAPSIGVATFDALGANGKPYQAVGGLIEPSDTLTSNYINLKDFVNTNGARQNLSAADSIYMTFFLQPKGLCYAPKSRDSMQLEFRNSAGQWRLVRSFKGITDSLIRNIVVAEDTLPPFAYYAVPITQAEYFYGKFQFRFRNFGRTGGIYEVWHLDYVKIAPNRRLATIRNLDDMALVEQPRNPLTRYTSMPWRQAKANLSGEFKDSVFTRLYNHFAIARNPTNTNLKITTSENTTLVDNYTFIDGQNVPPSIFSQYVKVHPSTAASLNSIPATVRNLTITTEQNLEIAGQEGSDRAKAALRNDKVTRKTLFQNYLAYDDGTAEMQFTRFGDGVSTAIRYRLNVADTLRGVQFFFPFINGNALPDVLFNLNIWKDSLNTLPIFTQTNVKPFYLTQKADTLQGFTTYRLETKAKKDTFVVIPAGDFYVGWQNVGDVKIPIGLDRNDFQKSQYLYERVSGAWRVIDRRIGAVMVRPMIGGGVAMNSSALKVNELPLSSVMSIYPNPASDRLFFDFKSGISENYEVSIFSLMGKLEKREILRGPSLDINELATGVYVLRIRNTETNRVFNHKIVVQK